jgi:hypothetical protein
MPFPNIFATATSPVLSTTLDQNFNYALYNAGGMTQTTGSAGAYVLTPNPAISAYADGQMFLAYTNHTNTVDGPTLSVSGLPAKDILPNANGVTTLAGQIVTNNIYLFVYSGGFFIPLRMSIQQDSVLIKNPAANIYDLSSLGFGSTCLFYLHTASYPNAYLPISFVDKIGNQGSPVEVAYAAGTITTIRAVVESDSGTPAVRILQRVLTVATGGKVDTYLTMDGIYSMV